MSRSNDPMTKDKAGYGPRAAPRTHRLDESAAGYSLAGWSPPEPASASPAALIMLLFGWIRYAFSVNCNTSPISWPRLTGPLHFDPSMQASSPNTSVLRFYEACQRVHPNRDPPFFAVDIVKQGDGAFVFQHRNGIGELDSMLACIGRSFRGSHSNSATVYDCTPASPAIVLFAAKRRRPSSSYTDNMGLQRSRRGSRAPALLAACLALGVAPSLVQAKSDRRPGDLASPVTTQLIHQQNIAARASRGLPPPRSVSLEVAPEPVDELFVDDIGDIAIVDDGDGVFLPPCRST